MHKGTATPPNSANTAEFDLLQSILHDQSSQQKRRGTFINHTPRSFEMRSQKSTEFQLIPGQPRSRPFTTHYESNGEIPHPPPKEARTSPATFSSKEVALDLSPTDKASPKVPFRGSIASSFASRVVDQSLTSTAPSSQEPDPTTFFDYCQTKEKRQRRQTPYRITAPNPASRYSLLETQVTQCQHEGTNSVVADLPPKVNVEIEDIAEASAFRAIQEYFDSQRYEQSSGSTNCHSLSPPNIPLPASPEGPQQSFPNKSVVKYPANELDVPEEPPELPRRNSSRLRHTPIRHTAHALSCDFAKAAEGQYSPWDNKQDILTVPMGRGVSHPLNARQAARAGSSTLGRMAPPILGHEAISSSAHLNDLSHYLKNTGPITDSTLRPPKRNHIFKMFKAKQKKSLATRYGSIEGSPNKNRAKVPMLACAREMRTSSGARHLRIVVPTDTLSNEQTVTVPVFSSGSKRRSRHISITWTDEMLSPLSIPGLEHAIPDFNDSEGLPTTQVTPARSPKCSSVPMTPVSVEGHSTMTRQERARARKLRDLEKIKRRNGNGTAIEGTMASASVTPTLSPSRIHRSPIRSGNQDEDEGQPSTRMDHLQNRVALLQRQNTELAEALARMMGLEMEDGNLEADMVLTTYKHLRSARDMEEDEGEPLEDETVVSINQVDI